MSRLRLWLSRLAGLLSTRRRDRDLEAEFNAHLEMHTDALVEAGVSRDDARRQALARAGGLEAAKEAYRDQRSVPALEHILRTLRQAATGFRRRPGYPLVVVISLALGVGANTAMFTLVDQVLRRPLPYPDAQNILTVGVARPDGTSWDVFQPDVDVWTERSRTLVSIAAVNWYPAVISGDGNAEYVSGAFASADLLRVIGATPEHGRWFTADDITQRARVAVISHDLWQRQFGGSPDIIGRTLKVYGEPRSIVGVMGAGVGLPLRTQFWLPSAGSALGRIVVRPQPGVPLDQIAAELTALSPSVVNLRKSGSNVTIAVTPLQDQLFGSAAPALRLLFGATLLLLLIACANIANLSLARAFDRRREWAVRATLGASRGALAGLVVAENLLLAVAGGAIGVMAAKWTTGVLVALAPPEMVVPDGVGVGVTSVLFTAALVVVAALAVSLGPALVVTRGDFERPLGGSTIRPGRASAAFRRALVTAQLATALLLMTGSALLLRSTANASRTNLGFEPRGVVAATVSLMTSPYRGDETRVQQLLDDISRRVSALPGVEHVTFGPAPLVAGRGENLRDGFSMIYYGPGRPSTPIWVKYVDAQYFTTFRIAIKSGRALLPTDDAVAPAVALLNGRAARMFFPNGGEIGQPLPLAPGRMSGGKPITIVGVTQDVRQRDVVVDAEPEVFVSLAQQRLNMSAATVAIRTAMDPAALLPAVRQTLRDIDPDLAPTRLTTMTSVVDASLARYRFLLLLLGALAGLSVVLATFGLYAVVAYLATQRTREIGVRLALGAQRRNVIALLGREVVVLLVAGIAIGLSAAWSLSGTLASFLYDMQPTDLASFVAAPLLLGAVTCVAAYVPAQRASRMDPVKTLKAD